MKFEATSTKAALLAFGISAFTAFSASAQVTPQRVPDRVEGELFLGVRAAGGVGASSSYLIKIGPDTIYSAVSEGSSIPVSSVAGVSIGNVAADLTAQYGSNWQTRTDLFWGIFGTKNATNPAVFGSKERPSVSVASTPWVALNGDDRSGTASAIISVSNSINGYNGRTSTVNSLLGTFQPNTGESSSYFFQVATPGVTDFGTFSQWGDVEANLSKSLDVYRISASATAPVTRIGYFSISGSGAISFTRPSSTPTIDPAADNDGDGYTNGQEDIAGTSISDPSDFFRVQSVVYSTGSAQVSFKPVAARTYALQYSEDLQSGWANIDQFIAGSAPAALHQFVDTNATRTAKPKGFYRIQVSKTAP